MRRNVASKPSASTSPACASNRSRQAAQRARVVGAEASTRVDPQRGVLAHDLLDGPQRRRARRRGRCTCGSTCTGRASPACGRARAGSPACPTLPPGADQPVERGEVGRPVLARRPPRSSRRSRSRRTRPRRRGSRAAARRRGRPRRPRRRARGPATACSARQRERGDGRAALRGTDRERTPAGADLEHALAEADPHASSSRSILRALRVRSSVSPVRSNHADEYVIDSSRKSAKSSFDRS